MPNKCTGGGDVFVEGGGVEIDEAISGKLQGMMKRRAIFLNSQQLQRRSPQQSLVAASPQLVQGSSCLAGWVEATDSWLQCSGQRLL